ncbi:hypothetical protein CC86DRAFT_312914 [Ophiobolus disseminans]|uniref:Uncharacterized protein n=1 Tax=Ophiobolus disseminans TaxID=1469910 RepID=A0A6A7AHE8_9PLEO|nr:hypothetical protein CC86DRAFT_312914 [Ophiobolus disseminans]
MAYNWDKLTKAQREYSKPKFATSVVDKALKKQPNNPYLLTWKCDLGLQQTMDPKLIAHCMTEVHKQPIAEFRLLAYMYKIYLEAIRRSHGSVQNVSVGVTAIECWQATAKTLRRRDDRMTLWNTLFRTALDEDLWEDVRFAVVNYNKEGPSDKKQAQYSLILATQLAAEARLGVIGHGDQMAQLQMSIALKLMKQAYTASPDDPTAVKDIRDLRFMGIIFGRQRRSKELQDLWDEPPETLLPLISRHSDDLRMLTMDMLLEEKQWRQLEQHCRLTLETTRSRLELASTSKNKLWELCAWKWGVWTSLNCAVEAGRPYAEGREIIMDEIKACFKTPPRSRDRPIYLTHIKLGSWVGTPVQADCMEYFEHHGRLTCCFDDLRPTVENFSWKDTSVFLSSIFDFTNKQLKATTADRTELDELQQAMANVLKFQYMLTISRRRAEDLLVLSSFFKLATQHSRIWPENADVSCLAVYSLLTMHHSYACNNEQKNPLEMTSNSRILLQATMYARHLVEKDKEKQNRTFALLAARLHLNLGLGTIAFRLFRHTKCKEMLMDTLSPYMLSRISQTHPFDVKTYGGFSADEELTKVINTIDRMEEKTAGYFVTDLSTFQWDQALHISLLKEKLKSSLTKHICSLERRRIARLKGESVDQVPTLDWKTYRGISDNVDTTVFPNFETRAYYDRASRAIMPVPIPEIGWLDETHYTREHASQRLHNEAVSFTGDLDPFTRNHDGDRGKQGFRFFPHIERSLVGFWDSLTTFMNEIYAPRTKHHIHKEDFEDYLDCIEDMRLAMEKLRMPGSTTLKLEDEPTMFHENMLMSCYARLEVLRATYRLVVHLRESVIKAKVPHIHKKTLPDKYDSNLLQSTEVCFQAVRDVAQSYIDLILRRGVEAIKAQVRWGNTGEALKLILSDEDVEYYAQEYVESALEAWRGVLKVKLK